MSPVNDVCQTLSAVRAGDRNAADELLELVYEPLRALAGRFFRSQPAAHTLQPTALVHEVFLKVVGRTDLEWNDRAHFMAICATAMRGILANHARRRNASKRGGSWGRVTLSSAVPTPRAGEIDILHLDEALERLAALSERQAKVVEYRFFSGMTIPEVAEALRVSERTVNDDWVQARAWISLRLSEMG